MKTVANLFATSYARLGTDSQQDRQFISLERLAPEEDSYCTFVKRVESLAQNEYWIAREKNILMLLKRIPHVARLRKEEDKTGDSYQTIKTKDAGISLAHWLRTRPQLTLDNSAIRHPLMPAQSFLQLAKYSLTALKEIHQVGVIHAQLRPDNICIPYQPHPYTFDTPLSLDFSKLTLIDFMFAVSNTLKLSRPLPIIVHDQPSTQSTLMRHALQSDQQQRHADLITRIDYSVDLYAIGFILEQIFQQGLIYPNGLDAELSMDIHHLLLELKSYDLGIPNAVKLRHLHLHPHNEYIAKIDHLLAICQQGQGELKIGLLFEPAQFLEEDSIFHLTSNLLQEDAVINNTSDESSSVIAQNPLDSVASATTASATSIEIKTMKETKPSTQSLATEQDYVELSKITVIALIVTVQIMYVLYTDGKSIGLDVFASMGLVAAIGFAVMISGKLFASPKPLPKRTNLFDDDDTDANAEPAPIADAPNTNNTSTDSQTAPVAAAIVAAAVATEVVEKAAEELSPAIEEASAPQEKVAEEPELSLEKELNMATEESEKEESKKEETAPPPVMLFNKASDAPKKDDDAIEVNKWVVIAIIVACQLAYVGLTTDFKGQSTNTATTSTDTETPAVEPVPSEVAPETPVADDLLAEPAPTDEAAVANIDLLTESSAVTTPQATTPKTRTKDAAADSMLLSGSPVSEAKPKKEKPAPKAKAVEAETNNTATTEANTTTEVTTTAPAETKAAEEVVTTKTKDVVEPKAETKPTTAATKTPKSLTRGLAEAQNAMGVHYYHGDGVKKDVEEAFKWFQKAANLGQPNAQFNLGMMYQQGEGVKQDLTEAAKWYRKSAEQGNASSQLNLGMMYISGRGVRQNIDEGAKLLNKAADQGDTTAKANLTWLLQQGYIKEIPASE